jgi:lauroyl/myristoyl acyltransferase
MLARVRRWVVARVTDAAVVAAPHLPATLPEHLGNWLSRWGPHLPVLARIIADNMRAVGVFSHAGHRAHFQQLGRHFAGVLHTLRCDARRSAAGAHDWLRRVAAREIELDASVHALARADVGQTGVVLVGPHITNYLLGLACLNQVLPLTVYLRPARRSRRYEARLRWYQASGVAWVSEPKDAARLLGRLAPMAAALRSGRVLFITPDLPQKRDAGIPVRFFDREVYLPGGPALLSLRTGSPLYALRAECDGARQRLIVVGPYVEPDASSSDDRRAAVQRRMQWFAGHLESFLRSRPALWYLWGDKRWTRVFRGDPRYCRAPGPLSHPAGPVFNPAVPQGA